MNRKKQVESDILAHITPSKCSGTAAFDHQQTLSDQAPAYLSCKLARFLPITVRFKWFVKRAMMKRRKLSKYH
jgi:hypothetical protein